MLKIDFVKELLSHYVGEEGDGSIQSAHTWGSPVVPVSSSSSGEIYLKARTRIPPTYAIK
jgi:hypothetical protein